MVKVVALHSPEQGVPKVVEVSRVVDPLFRDVALYDSGEQHWRSINWEHKAQWCCCKEKRQEIPQSAADMRAIKGPLMMLPMERVQPCVRKAPDKSFPWSEPAVQDVTMKEILDECPNGKASQIKKRSEHGMGRR
jgi:hypothetical protein